LPESKHLHPTVILIIGIESRGGMSGRERYDEYEMNEKNSL
jgi:hypothetical protein